MGDVYVKLDDAVKAVHATIINLCLKDKDTCAGDYSAYAIEALRSLPTDDGVTDEMVERASKAVIETANWRNMRGIDEGSPLWGKKVARAALQAALGPLPAPPSD